jgi:membrane-bound lytic murein transglycosylase F
MTSIKFYNRPHGWATTKITGILAIVTVVSMIIFLSLSDLTNPDDVLDHVRKNDTLRVLIRNTSTTYYELHDQPAGFEYELVKAFADRLNVKLELIIKSNIPDLLEALKKGEGDIVAAGITRTEEREALYRFGPDYQAVQQEVVCAKKDTDVSSAQDLVGKKIGVITGSSYEETLNEWKQNIPQLEWVSSHYLSTEQLLETVATGKLDCTLVDSNIVAINRRYYPKLAVAFPASESQQLAWVLPENSAKFERALEDFFDDAEDNGLMATINERYYGHVEFYDFFDLQVFRKRIKNRLPKFEKMIKKAAQKHSIPWTLLAAMAYQESHWNAKAKSPTGVRGLMMLTLNTAKSLGVKSRLDPEQSINGGARYLKRMMNQLPEEVSDENRLYFALAAYNIGMGHLKDSMSLAPTIGKNPYEWVDLKEVLPLLSDKYHYEKLKHGYARGNEPVKYVTRIRNYEDVLKKTLKIELINTTAS